MKVSELAEKLGFEIITLKNDVDISAGYTSDLLSDVMANCPEEAILITIQAHKNTLAVAAQLDLAGILLCNNKPVEKDMIETAEKMDIAILRTKENQFISSYKIYSALN